MSRAPHGQAHRRDVVSYVHNAAAPGMGKIGVLVAFTGGDEGFARQVAMHVAAVNPAALNEAELDPADRREGKAGPDGHRPRKRQARAVIEKMIEGRMKKFLAEVTLSEPAVRGEPRPDRRRRREGGRRRDHRLRPARGRRRHRGRKGRLRRRGRQGRQGLTPATGTRPVRRAPWTRGREILPRVFRLRVSQKKKNGTAEGHGGAVLDLHARKFGDGARVGISRRHHRRNRARWCATHPGTRMRVSRRDYGAPRPDVPGSQLPSLAERFHFAMRARDSLVRIPLPQGEGRTNAGSSGCPKRFLPDVGAVSRLRRTGRGGRSG
jgi:hypothetical protein